MSALRNLGKGVAGFFFVVSLILAVTLFNLTQITEQETLKEVVGEVFEVQSGGQEIPISEESQQMVSELNERCKTDGSAEFEVGGIVVDCGDAESIEAGGATDFVVSEFVDSVYDTDYDCDLIECVVEGEEPFPLLVTDHANDFYKESMNYVIVAAVAFGALFVMAARGLKNRLRGLGFSLLWVSVPLIVGSFFVGDIVNLVAPAEIAESLSPVLDSILGKVLGPAINVNMYILAAGAALTAASYIIKPGMFGFLRKK